MRSCGDFAAFWVFSWFDGDGISCCGELNAVSCFDEFFCDRYEVILVDAIERDAVIWATGHGASNHVGACFDTVWDDGVFDSV